MATLVIKEWTASNQPIDDSGAFVHIAGRQGGLLAWILALLKIDPTTRIRVLPTRVEFASASLAGTENKIIPIQNVCSTSFGYYKPWKKTLVFFTLLTLISSLMVTIMFSDEGDHLVMLNKVSCVFLAGIASAIYYALNKTLSLGFVEHSGVCSYIRFKRSVIEGRSIDEAQARQISEITSWLIDASRRGE